MTALEPDGTTTDAGALEGAALCAGAEPADALAGTPRALCVLPSGELLDARGRDGPFDDARLWVRAADSAAVLRTIADVAPPIAVSPSGTALLCGRGAGWSSPRAGLPQHRRDCHVRLLDTATGRERERYPLDAPFVWLDDRRFVARSAGLFQGELGLDRELAARHPRIAALFNRVLPYGLVHVDTATGDAEALSASSVHERWSYAKCLAASPGPRASVLYFNGRAEVGALGVDRGAVLWSEAFVPRGPYMRLVFELTASADGTLVAAAIGPGNRGDRGRDLVVLDATTGATVLELELGARLAAAGLLRTRGALITALAWHPAGWLAVGTSAGLVARVELAAGRVLAYRAAPSAVEAMAFADGGRALMVASREPGIRRWVMA